MSKKGKEIDVEKRLMMFIGQVKSTGASTPPI